MVKKTFLVALLFVMVLISGYPQTKKELRKEKALKELNESLELIQSKTFVFEADFVNTSIMGQKNLLSPPNTLEIRKDSVFCELPFFGRAYHINPSEPGGFRFDEAISDWKMSTNERKMMITLSFKANKPNDWFQCTLVVTGSKNATLTVSSQNRETLSYWGTIFKK